MKTKIAIGSFALFAGLVMLLPVAAKDNAKQFADGEQIFAQRCASCHSGGGNDIAEHHPIVGSKQLASVVTFKSYLSQPPGHMPYYKEVVNDKETLQALYKYCKQLKKSPLKQATLDQLHTR